jgi:hypothetical protein
MILAVFTCRGRPAALNGATLRWHGSLWDGSSLGGTFRRAFLRRLAPALLSEIEGLWVTPLAVPLAVPPLLGFGTCQGNSRAASPAHGKAPSPRSGRPCVTGKSVGSGRHLQMAVLVPNRYASTAAGIGDRRRWHPVIERHAWRSRQDLPSHIKNSPPVCDLADAVQWGATTFRQPLYCPESVLSLLGMKGYRSSLLTSFFPFLYSPVPPP